MNATYLTDDEWAAVAPVILEATPPRDRGRHRSTDLRLVASAVAHYWRTGTRWRRLPAEYPPWPTVYTYFRRWLLSGVTGRLRAILAPREARP